MTLQVAKKWKTFYPESFTYRQMLNKTQILICFVFFQKQTGDDIDLILDKRHKIFKHFGQY